MAKTKNDIQEKDTKVKSSTKKTKKVEVDKDIIIDEKIDDVKVDVEIDLRNDLKQPCVYIRRKRSI